MITKEQKAAWILALRTKQLPDGTKIEQGKSFLHQVEDNKMCCLGVACALFVPESTEVDGSCITYMRVTSALPRQLASDLGIDTLGELGHYEAHENYDNMYPALCAAPALAVGKEYHASLASANDYGVSFAKIADFLEINLRTSD